MNDIVQTVEPTADQLANRALQRLDPEGPRAGTELAMSAPAELLRMALQQKASLDTIEKFMDLNDRHEKSQARKAFVAAMTAFKAEPLEIVKRKLVSFTTRDGDTTSYHHAELSDITAVVVPAMARHGLSHRWDLHQGDGIITVDCVLTHELGHSEKVTMFGPPDTSGKKNAIQQIASAITYLQRYTLLSATGLATKGADDDGRGTEPAPEWMTEDHQATVTAKAEEVSKTTLRTVLKSYKVEALSDIPDIEYESIIRRLEATLKSRAAQGGAK